MADSYFEGLRAGGDVVQSGIDAYDKAKAYREALLAKKEEHEKEAKALELEAKKYQQQNFPTQGEESFTQKAETAKLNLMKKNIESEADLREEEVRQMKLGHNKSGGGGRGHSGDDKENALYKNYQSAKAEYGTAVSINSNMSASEIGERRDRLKAHRKAYEDYGRQKYGKEFSPEGDEFTQPAPPQEHKSGWKWPWQSAPATTDDTDPNHYGL